MKNRHLFQLLLSAAGRIWQEDYSMKKSTIDRRGLLDIKVTMTINLNAVFLISLALYIFRFFFISKPSYVFSEYREVLKILI